jgi:2-keto-4-pentenoate hydratase/2-oxohepta-3-ene-1,7-dioic acid hydratase in catechol pathway
MHLISYYSGTDVRLGVLKDDGVVDLQRAARDIGTNLPFDMRSFIVLGEAGIDLAETALRPARPMPLTTGQIAPPIPDLRKNVFAIGRNYNEHMQEGARARGADLVQR